jgi:hypothetical protein
MFVQEGYAIRWPILLCPLNPFSVGLVSMVLLTVASHQSVRSVRGSTFKSIDIALSYTS